MIIGLNGRLKAGKDTTYAIIKELLEPEHQVIQISFAKALKLSAAASIGSDVASLDNWKNDEEAYFIRPDRTKFTSREYLQWYGTEAHRELFGDNFWVDVALPLSGKYSPPPFRAVDMRYERAIYVVTDMRFPNEAERVLKLGGRTVKVVRETETKFAAHASEQNIDHMIQYFLDNTTTLEDLRGRTKLMLKDFMSSKTPAQELPIFTENHNIFPVYASAEEAEETRGWKD